jgi:hypothetical protein
MAEGARWHHGWVPANAAAVALKEHKLPEIHKSDLSSGDARRSRAVSSAEFQRVARRGAAKYKLRSGQSSPHALKGDKLNALIDRAHTEAMKPWGGLTTDSHTGKDLPGNADKYALTARAPGMDTVSVPEGASKAEFAKAMRQAVQKYGPILDRKGHSLGVFHDNDKGTIDIDPVLIADNLKDAEDIGAFTHAVGGAYHFKSGDGFWPPHVKETVSMAKATHKLVDLAVLTAARRKEIPARLFALPPDGYPIPDRAHALAALSLVSQHGTPQQQAIVRAAVRKHYPDIKVSS